MPRRRRQRKRHSKSDSAFFKISSWLFQLSHLNKCRRTRKKHIQVQKEKEKCVFWWGVRGGRGCISFLVRFFLEIWVFQIARYPLVKYLNLFSWFTFWPKDLQINSRWLSQDNWLSIIIPRHLVSVPKSKTLFPNITGFSSPQKGLWVKIMASDLPVCMVSLNLKKSNSENKNKLI